MTTAQTLITDAYIESKVADAIDGPGSNQLTVGLRLLNRIIARASVRNFLIPYSTSENFSTVASTGSYTMGSGGTASSSRARKITNAYLLDSSNNSFPLEILTSEANYNAIPDKTTTGQPYLLWYDPVYPTGVIYLQYVPNAVYTIYIESQKDLHSSLSLGTTVSLPAEYEDALVLTLGAKIARANGAETEQSLLADAASAWRGIMGLNASQKVPSIRLPFSRSGDGRSFNINSGFTYNFGYILG